MEGTLYALFIVLALATILLGIAAIAGARPRWLYAVLAVLVLVCTGLVGGTDAVQWRTMHSKDTVDAYKDYLDKYPSGAHVAEAQSRLRELDEQLQQQKVDERESAQPRRNEMAARLSGRDQQQGAAARLLAYLFQHPETPRLRYALVRRGGDEPGYDGQTRDAVSDAMTSLSTAIGYEISPGESQNPPFGEPTIACDYSIKRYGHYKQEGVFGPDTDGFSVEMKISFHVPDSAAPAASTTFSAYPAPDMTYRNTTLQGAITSSVFANLTAEFEKRFGIK